MCVKYLFVFSLICSVFGASYLEQQFQEEVPDWTETPKVIPPCNITYILYNRFTDGSEYISTDEVMSNIDPSVGTVILIDGHIGYIDNRFRTQVRQGLLDYHNVNVVVMDWTSMAVSYIDALANQDEATEDFVDFLRLLQRSTGREGLEDVHVVGFGIGAHLAGGAGFRFAFDNPIGRITGLDPTRREWRRHALNRNDATYVEKIHTNGGEGGIGGFEVNSHVDFIPNGGSRQPGCLNNNCSHNRSWQLFLSSLKSSHLVGRKCYSLSDTFCFGSPLHLGGVEVKKESMIPGIYCLRTRMTFPF